MFQKYDGPQYRIGLVLQTGQELMRGITRGVYRFLRVNRHWHIQGDGQFPLLNWDQVADWEGDGIIAVVNTVEQMKILLSKNALVVNAGSRIVDPRVSTVACDSRAIGALAAEHLLECGLKNFLFMSELRWENERQRYEAFSNLVVKAGHQCESLKLRVNEFTVPDASGHYRPDIAGIAAALKRSPKPVGVCTPNSELARTVGEVALDCGFEVPDEIAIIGVNDDPLICESMVPHLSAVIQPAEQIGYQAALLLNQRLTGVETEPTTTLLAPLGVSARQSTAMLAVEDEDVREALKFIRSHSHNPIEVSDVAAHVAISRRALEMKFKAAINRTPALELRRVRIHLAKKLLIETQDPITNIVFAAGFNSRQVFSSLFRKATGDTPSEYRRRFRIDVLDGSSRQ